MRDEKRLRKVLAFVMCFTIILTYVMPLQNAFALDNKDQTGNVDIVRSLSLSYKLKGESNFIELLSPYKIADSSKIDKLHAKYTFALEDHIDSTTGEAHRTIKSGDYYLIDLPEKLRISNPVNGSILGNESRVIANYSFVQKADSTWQVKIEYTDYIDSPNEYDIHGEMEFDFELDLSSVGEGTSTTISIPIDNENSIDIDITKPVPPATKPVSLTKTVSSYNHQTRELVWNVKMMPAIGVFSGCVFTDTIDINRLDLKSIKHGNITLIEGEDYTYDTTSGELIYTIPNGRDGANFQNITITTVAKRSIYGSLTATTINNQANLSGGDSFVDIDSNSAAHTITPNWLGKSGTTYQGNKILWTIDVNITNQAMYNAVITDYFQADVKLDKTSVKLGTTQIPIYDDAHTPANTTEVYGILTTNTDGTSKLEIFLPRGKANASNAKQTITLVTDVVSPDAIAPQSPTYNNTATLDCNYITDGDGEGTLPTININQVGVAVPYVSVVKGHTSISADDKRNGTITWTISAASNLSSYGKSQIIDTLPSDQDYIADEIYWGSQKIDETTEPKAEISADGRTLTITFNNNKALQTQQNFTVKTKIKQEYYGQNINRDFTNQVRASLLSSSTGEVLVTSTDTDSVKIQNTVISKTSSEYNGNDTKAGQNPRVNFSITINNNLMPLKNVIIKDDLSRLTTSFRKSGESAFNTVSGVKWTYVTDTLKITRNSGTRDSLDLSAIIASATYDNNIITINFGNDVSVNDKYTITFTAELDVSQNAVFKENGTIRCNGNIAEIIADGLKTGTISTPPTGSSNNIDNEVLGKSGVHLIAEQQVLWTINLNQHRVALDNTIVVDVLPKGLTLDPTSIKLYKNVIGTNGKFITGNAVEAQGTPVAFNYTYLPATGDGMEGRYILTVDLPDNQTDYILRFATDIDRSLLGKQINNSAYFVGEEALPNITDTSTMTLSSSSGGGSTTKSSVTVNKLSKDTGAPLNGAIFSLHWLRNGDANDPVFVRTLTATNGSIIFRGLTRGEKYTITEITPPSGYLLDNPNPVQITVPSTGTGDVAPLSFYNTPIKTGNWTPTAIKKLDGKNIVRPFSFEIREGSVPLLTGVTDIPMPNGDYTVSFSMNDGINAEGVLTFTDDHIFKDTDPAGTSHLVTTKAFNMREIASSLPGYGFDTKVYPLIVKVYNIKGQDDLKVVIEDGAGNILSDNGGKFTADGTPVFSNTYRANGSIQLSAEKKVIGHDLAADMFSFELYEGATLLQTAKNSVGAMTEANTYIGNINFDVINYTQADVGTKTYRIIEKNNGLPGYTYDLAEYLVTVKIDDNDDGTLTSTIQSIKKMVNGVTTNESKVSFTNVYTTTDIDVNLTGTKVLSGRKLSNEQFSFKLNRVTSNGSFIEEIGTVKNNEGTIAFPKLTFKQSDIGLSYYYQITEIDEGSAGYTYDKSVYTVQIDVMDNHDGTLRTTRTITKNGEAVSEIAFANIYRATGKTQISAKKTLTGKALPNEQFSFKLQQIDISGNAIGEKVVVKNAANGNVIFPEITYSEDDAGKDFYYTVSEINDGIGGYTYDETVYTVRVSVLDNGDGTLTAQQEITAPTGKTAIAFANVYTTSNTVAKLTATKFLNGRVLEDQQFTFILNQVTETGTLIKEIERVKNAQNGSVAFGDITYTQSDMGKTYYYQISEFNDGKAGYDYDPSVYTVQVQVVDNNDGTLSIMKTIQKNGSIVTDAVFTNTYTTSDISLQFNAHKTLNGRVLENGQFSYQLKSLDEDGRPENLLETVANKADGSIAFTPITFKQADMGKTFYYSINEVISNKSGYTYDDRIYIIKVDVIDNGDGTLSTNEEITAPADSSAMDFINVYTTSATFASVDATKVLNGRELEDNQFIFVLNQVNENGDLIAEIQRVKNKADGKIIFDDILYTQADMGKTYYYQIAEVNDEKSGYSYDTTIYSVIIEVVDNGDGTLSTVKSIQKNGVSVTDAIFTNAYTTSDTNVQFNANKTLNGRTLENGQFKYILKNIGKDGTLDIPIETVTNKANGSIAFAPINYTQADMGKTYYYSITEINDNRPGYEYDNTVYTIIVNVVDNGDGTLRTEYTITKPGNTNSNIEADNIEFSNVYTAKGSVQINAKKILKGLELTDKMFAFILMDENGKNILQTVYNDADGNIVFDELFFNQDQLGVHNFIIREVAGNKEGFTYDNATYFITITVTDNGDGTLNTEISVVKDNGTDKTNVQNIIFTNEYQAPIVPPSPKTGDELSILWYSLLALLSCGILIFIKRKMRIID